jgi:hypothetical protein
LYRKCNPVVPAHSLFHFPVCIGAIVWHVPRRKERLKFNSTQSLKRMQAGPRIVVDRHFAGKRNRVAAEKQAVGFK